MLARSSTNAQPLKSSTNKVLSMSSRTHSTLALAAFLVLIASLPARAEAQKWDFYPPIGPEHAGIKPSLDGPAYDALRTCLTEFESAVGAQYFAGVVDISDYEGREGKDYSDAVPYVDAYFKHILRLGQPSLDTETHILMVLSIKNRGIAIHPGNKWVDLGFAQQEIKNTIDSSRFGQTARDGDLGGALCYLVGAVDQKLLGLQASKQSRLERLPNNVERERVILAAIAEDLQAVLAEVPLEPAYAASLQEELYAAEATLVDVLRAVEREELSVATTTLSSAKKTSAGVENSVHDLRRRMRSLEFSRTELAEYRRNLEQRWDASWELPQRALEELSACEAKVESLSPVVLRGAEPDWDYVSACSGWVSSSIEKADQRVFWFTTGVPLILLFLLALGLVVFAAIKLSRRKAAAEIAKQLVKSWQWKVGNASERLLALEEAHTLYFGAITQRWEGESRALDQRCADVVNQLFLLNAKAVELGTDASRRLTETEVMLGIFAVQPFLDIQRLLTTEPVVLETGAPNPVFKITAPLETRYESTAAKLMVDLDALYTEARPLLQAIQTTFEAATTAEDRASAASVRAIDAVSRREAFEMSGSSIRESFTPILEELERLRALRLTDPIAATSPLEEIHTTLVALAERVEAGNQALEILRGDITALGKTLRARVDGLRQEEGFALNEPGFDPTLRLDRGARAARDINDLVAHGDDALALERARVLAADFAKLEREVEDSARARDEVPTRVEAQRREREALVVRIPTAKHSLEALSAEHAAANFAVESDNLEELADVLERLVSWEAHIVEDHAAECYLSALADLETADELLRAGAELLDAIGSIEVELAQARDDAREARTKLEALCALAKTFIVTQGNGVASQTRVDGQMEIDKAFEVVRGLAAEKPDWFTLRADLAYAIIGLHDLIDHCEVELQAMARTHGMVRTLGSRLEALEHAVEVEQRDRPHVAAAAERTREAYEEWRKAVEDKGDGGVVLEKRGAAVEVLLASAETTWTSELDTIKRAEQELAAAMVRAKSPTKFSEGVVATYHRVESHLLDANKAAVENDWDAVLAAAREVVKIADKEDGRCTARVSSIVAARSSRRRATYSFSSSSSSSTSRPSSYSSSSFGSSWSSSSSRSSRSSSSSSSYSSGRSSSGGSSWKGGSSSSGGSSW